MVGMFCSLKEAAQRLRVSEDEIEAMLERGALREFREGPYRLVKVADLGILAQSPVGSRSSFIDLADDPSPTTDEREARLPHCAAATVRAPALCTSHPRRTGQTQQRRMPAGGMRRSRPASSGMARRETGRPMPRTDVQTQPVSVRQWFWNGLVQDRPVAIALFSGLVLLVLSALIAGACFLGSLIAGRIS